MSEVLTCRKCGKSFNRTSNTGRIPTMCPSCRRDKPNSMYVERESMKGQPHPPLSRPRDEPKRHPFFPSAKPTVDLGSCERCWYRSDDGCRMCKRGDMGTCEFYAYHEIWKPRR